MTSLNYKILPNFSINKVPDSQVPNKTLPENSWSFKNICHFLNSLSCINQKQSAIKG